MKFIMTAICLSLSLTACGGPLKDKVDPNNIDGTYFYNEQKGHTDISKNDDGSETTNDVIEGDVYSIMVINKGEMDIYELDPQDGIYRVQESSVMLESHQLIGKLKNYSCTVADETASTAPGEQFASNIRVEKDGIMMDQGFALKLNDNQAKLAMEKILKDYSLIKETNCQTPHIQTLSSASTRESAKAKLQDFLEN
jgi:hypothetical protein